MKTLRQNLYEDGSSCVFLLNEDGTRGESLVYTYHTTVFAEALYEFAQNWIAENEADSP